MFITFEGIDGSGKSTQAELLHKKLKKENRKVILVREPGGTKLSEKVRAILLHKKDIKMAMAAEFLLFSAGRNQLTNEVIIPHLYKDYIVISDRYYDSSSAYQGYAGGLNIKAISAINNFASEGLTPDITFLLDISYKESRKRISRQPENDRIENRNKRFFDKAVKGYKQIAEQNKKRVIMLDALLAKDILAEKIYNKILKLSI